MNRKISWKSYEFDEIELVYEKAEADESIGKMLEELEELALTEARNNCGLLTADGGGHISPEQFDDLADIDKETVIRVLSEMGLGVMGQDIQTATIFVHFTSQIQKFLACTIFNVLNRLEKLDGAINILNPNFVLELRIPMGGKKGLFQWEILIMQLYPWISVREVSTNEIAEGETVSESKSSAAKASRENIANNTVDGDVKIDGSLNKTERENEKKLVKKPFLEKFFSMAESFRRKRTNKEVVEIEEPISEMSHDRVAEGKPCDAFQMEDVDAAREHMDYEIVRKYGDYANGHYLHTWDEGERFLAKCKNCGGYILVQRSEFHDMVNGDDSYYVDYFPVNGQEAADKLNRDFDGFELERKFPGRYLMKSNLRWHWSAREK